MTDDRAERIVVTVSVATFWFVLAAVPVLIFLLWEGLPRSNEGGGRDPRLLLALVAAPMFPCFALIASGLWNLSTFTTVKRAFNGLDVLCFTALLCLAILITIAINNSVMELKSLYDRPSNEICSIGDASACVNSPTTDGSR